MMLFVSFAFGQVTITPYPFQVDQDITIEVDLSQSTCTTIPTSTTKVYMHSGVGPDSNPWTTAKGNWGMDDGVGLMTKTSGTKWSITINPKTYFGLTNAQANAATKMGMVFRNAAGTQKLGVCPGNTDIFRNVGAFQVTLTSPTENSTTLVNAGTSVNIAATNTGGSATYILKANGTQVATSSGATFSSSQTVNQNTSFTLEATQGATTITKKFFYVVNGTPTSQAMPAGLEDGVNYSADATKATLVLNAPFKDYVYVAGSFNNWNPTPNHLMKKDPTSNKFWLEITGLTAGQFYTFQYWVCDNTNRPTNSPAIVKTADPFSDLVLSPYDDPEIKTLGVYPNLPDYPAGQEREVSVIQTGSNSYRAFNWSSATTNFVKPNKKDLVIYEALVRDFDASRTYQDLINRIDYFKNLKINAIQLMPVMEFEGNLSWGYNTVFHLALDKRYGPPAKLKEFVDLCHQNGIAVILDVALNHVFGRSPLERMWMVDTDNDGWSNAIAAENPYCNVTPLHSYNVGADLNHYNENAPGTTKNMTGYYVKRTLEQWIKEYKVDGFRWDLTKGFTNSCPSSAGNQDNCTNTYKSDRVAKLKYYSDLQWNADPNSIVAFEHLGDYNEESEWLNYRLNEGKGVLCWRRMDDQFGNIIKGNAQDLSGVTDTSTYRIQADIESHDEDRIVYKALSQAGQTQGNLAKALSRVPAAGALFFLAPGPKMIYQFGELGIDQTIYTCSNGTTNFPDPDGPFGPLPDPDSPGDCRLDTKPQNQWTSNWLGVPARKKIYDDWSKLINIKKTENVVKNGQHSYSYDNGAGRTRLDVWTSTQPTNSLSYILVHTNNTNNSVTFPANFPYTGTWYNLLDNNTTLNVTSTSQNITLAADGGYVVYGNKPFLNSEEVKVDEKASGYLKVGNPVLNKTTKVIYKAEDASLVTFNVYSLDGKLVSSTSTNENEGSINLSLNVSSGVYLLELKSDTYTNSTKLIVK